MRLVSREANSQAGTTLEKSRALVVRTCSRPVRGVEEQSMRGTTRGAWSNGGSTVVQETDEALLGLYAREDDRAALEEIVRRHWPEAFRLAHRMLGDRGLAEDVAQQSFIALIRGAGKFEEGRSFGPWFRTVVMNTARNAGESKRARKLHEERATPKMAAEESDLDARQVESCLTTLPYELRSPLVLHFYEGCSFGEVAEVLGCAKSTVQSRIDRGLEQLRESLAGVGCSVALPALVTWLSKAQLANASFATAPAPKVSTLIASAGRASALSPLLKWGVPALVLGVAVAGVALLGGERPTVRAALVPEKAPAPVVETPTPAAPEKPVEPAPVARETAPAPVTPSVSKEPAGIKMLLQTLPGVPAQGTRFIVRGDVTSEDTKAPLGGALVRIALPVHDMRDLRSGGEAPGVTVLEARSDQGGHFELQVPTTAQGSEAAIDVFIPGYRSLWGPLMSGGDPRRVTLEPGASTELELRLPRALYVQGHVTDEEGAPVADVEVTALSRHGRGYGFVTVTTTDAQGRFEVYDYDVRAGGEKGAIELKHPGFKVAEVGDVYVLSEADRRDLKVVLKRGHTISGRVVSSKGEVVPGVMVEVKFKDYQNRRAVLTDAAGRFSIEGLPSEHCSLRVHSMKLKERVRRELDLDSDPSLELALEPIVFKVEPETVKLLGMTVATGSEELKDAYDCYEAACVVILDPGPDHRRFGIGVLAEGYQFWLVGEEPVKTVEELAKKLLDESKRDSCGVHVVYRFSDLEMSGTNTQYMKLTDADLEELRAFLRSR
jgi:RNA polymerase sigma-70 factor (ECF subfamily)